MRERCWVAMVLVLVVSALPASGATGCSGWLRAWLTAPLGGVRSQLAEDYQRLIEIREIQDFPARRAAEKAYSAPRPKSWWEKGVVLADWALATWFGARVAAGFAADPSALVTAVLLMPPTLYVTDFVTQVFHKWLDSYASEASPLWGKPAREFRKHHEFPNNLNETDYLSHVSAFGLLMAPFFAVTPFVDLPPEFGASLWVFLVAALNATEVHKQAHKKVPDPIFGFLQWAGLAISRTAHLEHHKPPFEGEFGILNGWSNSVATRTGLWLYLDKLWWKLRGRMPHNWIQDPRSIPPEVVQELAADLQAVPEELWAAAELYPQRMPEELAPVVERSREKWREQYIALRRHHFQELALTDAALAEQEFQLEQKAYPWIYQPMVVGRHCEGRSPEAISRDEATDDGIASGLRPSQ